ncbi:MAG: hypothetical protein QF464_20240, partial [Myxococcota bacterium]|nr:hypothetical protein [Myxococcota bacterium]
MAMSTSRWATVIGGRTAPAGPGTVSTGRATPRAPGASPLTESGLICGTQDWYEFTMLDVGGPTDEVTITFSQSEGDLDIGLR